DVPQLDGAVERTGGERFAVGGEGERIDTRGVPLQRGGNLTGSRVAQPGDLVELAGGQLLAVGREGDGADADAAPDDGVLGAVGQVPDDEVAVVLAAAAADGQGVAVGAEGDGADLAEDVLQGGGPLLERQRLLVRFGGRLRGGGSGGRLGEGRGQGGGEKEN